MTPEERAEEIYQCWCEIDTQEPMLHVRIVKDIAAQIREAVEEAYEELGARCAEGTRMAIQATYEDAAKIAEELSEPWQGGEVSAAEYGMGRVIAKQIRARATEVSK